MKDAIYADIMKSLKDAGFKVTSTRSDIVAVLVRASTPISADEIYSKIKTKVDRATVYRFLELLEKTGHVSRFTFQNKHVYELSTHHSHYLICKSCDKVERIESCTISDIEKASLRASKQFSSIDHHTLQLTGICNTCS